MEADTPGFEVARLEPKVGISGSTTGELLFEGARAPAANLLGTRLRRRPSHRGRPVS